MKESVTKFDLESAFKALDEIDVPVSAKGIKANKPALTEIFSRKSKFDALFEEYYDIGSTEELGEAKEEREAEIAKAKLARIEKIVDLDADSPEDLLTSYVGKYIIQCPQCMTLFYKDKEDVVESEEDPTNVNVGEQCQHCGNESGYTLIGKVGEAEPEEAEVGADEIPTTDEELPSEEIPEETTEETSEESIEGDEDLGDFDLDAINLEDESVEEEKKEESFIAHTGEALVEEITDDKELDAKLEAHNEYIEYLRNTIAEEEATLEKTDNEQVKAAIQRRIDAFKADLEAALPEEVKNSIPVEADEEPAEEPVEEETASEESAEESMEESLDSEGVTLTEALHEDADLEVSAEEFKKLINDPEFKKPISDTAVRVMLNSEDDTKEPVEESVSLDENIFDKLNWTRAGKADWVLKNAPKDKNKLKVDNKGKLIPDTSNQRFSKFMVVCYKNKFSNGKPISNAPEYNNKNLVPADKPKFGDTYKQADNAAKGWSMREGNGPAFIYLAGDTKGTDAAFVCQYFEGKLYNDNIGKYFEIVQNDVKGAKLEAKGKMTQDEDSSEEVTETIETKEVKVSELNIGNKLKFDETIGEITKIDASKFGANWKAITIKFGEEESTTDLQLEATVLVVVETATEEADDEEVVEVVESLSQVDSLSSIMEQIDELQESSLEKLISDTLVETYSNVAGYRLTNCEYLNEKFNINGTIYFTSGKARKTTYTFLEAYNEEGKIKLSGLNEKLGLEKQFTLVGSVKDKALITESFKCTKK